MSLSLSFPLAANKQHFPFSYSRRIIRLPFRTHTWQFLISFGWISHISMIYKTQANTYIRSPLHINLNKNILQWFHYWLWKLKQFGFTSCIVHTYPSYPTFSSCCLASFATSIDHQQCCSLSRSPSLSHRAPDCFPLNASNNKEPILSSVYFAYTRMAVR